MFERIINAVLGPKTVITRTNVGAVQQFLRGFDVEGNSESPRIGDPYTAHVAVFRCINTVVNGVVRLPYLLEKNKKEQTRGPLVELIKNPDPGFMTWSELLTLITTQLHTTGNVFLLKDTNNSFGVPSALIPLPAHRVRPVRGDFLKKLEGWELLLSNRKVVRFEIDDILHFKYADNPIDGVMGVSPLEVARVAIDTDYAASIYNKSMLNSGGWPAGVLSYKGPGTLTREMRDEVRQEYQRTYGGPRGAGKLAVINKDWTWQQTGVSSRDMEFLESRKWNLSDISRAFNVPPMFLNQQEKSGLGDAGLRVEMKRFYWETIEPILRKIETVFNERLYANIDQNIKGRFDLTSVEALWDDFAIRIETAERLVKMGFSLNNVNQSLKLGLRDEAWGDENFEPMNMTTSNAIINGEIIMPGQSKPGLNDPEEELKLEMKKLELVDNSKSDGEDANVDSSPEEKQAASFVAKGEWFNYSHEAEEIKDRCSGKLSKELMRQRGVVVKALYSGSPLDGLIESREIAETIIPHIVDAYVTGYRSVNERANPKNTYKSAGLFAEKRFESLIEVGDHLEILIKKIKETSRAIGSDEDSIDRNIKGLFNKLTRKVGILARTEVYSAFNTGRYVAMRDIEIKRVMWLCGPSKCEDSDQHGMVGDLGVRFPNGAKHPGDTTGGSRIGCDCILLEA